MDRFDFDVREQIPNAGLSGLRSLLLGDEGQPRPGAERLLHKLDSLAALEEWRAFALTPKDWAARFSTLRTLFRPAPPAASGTHEMALQWRSQSDRARSLRRSARRSGARRSMPRREIGIAEYWRAVKSVLRLKPLRLEDGRRNVVHVMSAHEARQWVLPIVFVCGMVEKQFPQFHKQDPFFPDAARCRVNAAGIRVRTAAEFAREERALFDTATSRATMLTTLSYPGVRRARRTQPPLHLPGGRAGAGGRFRSGAPGARVRIQQPRGLVQIAAPDLLEYLRKKTARLSATALETFLQCPFQYFAQRLMRLKTAPPRPEERLSFLEAGQHRAPGAGRMVAAAAGHRAALRTDIRAPPGGGAHTQRLSHRAPAQRHARRPQALHQPGPVAARATGSRRPKSNSPFRSPKAWKFPAASIASMSRPMAAPSCMDYKYSAAQRVKDKLKNENLMQAPLYLMAAEHVNVQPVRHVLRGRKGRHRVRRLE